MATYATLTVPVVDIIGADFNASRASVWIEPNVPVVLADSIRVGGRREQVVNGVATFANLATTDSADNPASFSYRVTITAPPKGAQKREDIVVLTTADFPFTATANLKDIDEAWDDIVIPPEWRSDFLAQVEALRDEVVDLSGISTSDGVIANRITTPGTATQTALSATIAAEATPLVEDLAYVTPAVQAFLQKIKLGQQDAYWTHVGDSIDASTTLWVGELARWVGTQNPTHTVKFRIWESGTNAYSGWSTFQTGTGARTIWVSNGAVPGSATPYASARMSAMVWSTTPDLLTYGYNANEFPHTAAGAVTYVGRFLAFTEDALRGCNAQIVYVAKPPRPADPGGVELRVDAAREAVRAKGFGWIDFMQAFRDTPNYATALYLPEGTVVHPNATGQALMLDIAKRHFAYRPGVTGGGQSPSSLTIPGGNILPNGFFTDWTGADPAGWTINSNATCSKDMTNFETGTYGLRITPTASGTATSSLSIDILANRWRGQYVTVAARVLAPWGTANAAGLGRVGIASSGAGYTQQGSSEVPAGSGFQWRAVSLRIPDAATTLRIVLEARVTFTGASDWAVYDRVILAPGILPRDALPGIVL